MCFKKILDMLTDIRDTVHGSQHRLLKVDAEIEELRGTAQEMRGLLQSVDEQLTSACQLLEEIKELLKGTQPEQPTPVQTLWDPRLAALGMSIERDVMRRDGEYYLYAVWCTVNGSWDGVPNWARVWQLDTLGGDHHFYGRCEDLDGRVLTNTFALVWQGGYATAQPEPDGWANVPLYGGPWDPKAGPGPYDAFCFGGDKIKLGLPYNQHYSFFCVWRKKPSKLALADMKTLNELRVLAELFEKEGAVRLKYTA